MKYFKKIGICFLTISILVTHSNLINLTNVHASYKVSFDINSKGVYMINLDTDTVIFEQDADTLLFPASLTKVMTALVAIENVSDLENTVVTAPSYIFDEFVGINISTADIRHGEEVKMIDLLYALLLPSAGEAANIIADYVGGGNIQTFLDMMNAKAIELGASNTNFMNPHGLHHPDQVTTCKDMAIITRAALEYPIFEKITSTFSYLMPATNKHSEPRYITHSNTMMSNNHGIYYYPSISGVKTGTTDEAGRNLVSTASKNGYNYLLVTIGAPMYDENGSSFPYGTNKAFEDAIALYDWAFNSFETQVILKRGDILEEVSVEFGAEQDFITLVASRDVTALLPINVDPSTIFMEPILLANDVIAPVQQGAVLGKLQLKIQNEPFAVVDLVATENVYRNETRFKLNFWLNFFKQPKIIALLIFLALLIFSCFLLYLRHQRLRRLKAMRYRNNYIRNRN